MWWITDEWKLKHEYVGVDLSILSCPYHLQYYLQKCTKNKVSLSISQILLVFIGIQLSVYFFKLFGGNILWVINNTYNRWSLIFKQSTPILHVWKQIVFLCLSVYFRRSTSDSKKINTDPKTTWQAWCPKLVMAYICDNTREKYPAGKRLCLLIIFSKTDFIPSYILGRGVSRRDCDG